jgi:hypothetical protein
LKVIEHTEKIGIRQIQFLSIKCTMISATYGGDVFEEFLRMASFCFCHLGSPEPSLGNSVS